MKIILKIAAILMVAVFALTALSSCAKSMDNIVDKMKDLDEDEYTYEKFVKVEKEDIQYMFEEYDVDLDGDVDTGYLVGEKSETEDVIAFVIEFEERSDAKAVYEFLKEDIEDLFEDMYGEDYDTDKCTVKYSGNIVVFGHEDIIKQIW